jgi:cytochrome c oxidase assembly protein subunit 15
MVNPRKFLRLVLLATVAIYILMFTGGLVRVSGAGLGCPDWPTCFGRWLPPTDVSQLPPDIDPSRFNFTLAWIEYGNRMLGAIVGLLILVTALFSIRAHRDSPAIRWTCIGALILVAYVGWQGGKVVESHLQPTMVSVHMIMGMITASLLVFAASRALLAGFNITHVTGELRKQRWWIWLLIILALGQVTLGTQMRELLKAASENFPMTAPSDWFEKVGPLTHSHLGMGLVILVGTIQVIMRVMKKAGPNAKLVSTAGGTAIVLLITQVMIGLGFLFSGLPPVVQVFHMWVASLFVGSLTVLLAVTTMPEKRVD